MARSKASTPAQERRKKLAEQIKARGASPHNVWLFKPAFQTFDLFLNSDNERFACYALEGGPRFVEIDFGPLQRRQKSRGPTELATVRTAAGHAVSVSYCAGDAPEGFDAFATAPEAFRGLPLAIAPADIERLKQRIDNWRQILPAIRRVADRNTEFIERRIESALRSTSATVDEILQQNDDQPAAWVLGALGAALRRRSIAGDCDSARWCGHTRLFGEAT